MKQILFSLFGLMIFLFINQPMAVAAQTYPIAALGSCRDAKECYLYCEIPKNKAACWSYGKFIAPQVLGVTTITDEEKRQMEAKAKTLGITFPIAELGSCAGPAECRAYCENTANYQACSTFAQKHGLQEKPPTDATNTPPIDESKKQEILTNAKTELGCTSMESCRAICEQNRERCEQFAKKHNLYRPPQGEEQTKSQLIERAKTELGCDSYESCRKLCEENKERCMQFTRREDIRTDSAPREDNKSIGQELKGKCDTQESCKKYCEEHPDDCPGFKKHQATSPAVEYVGPSGCKTQAECEAYCKSNPSSCPGFSEGQKRREYQPSPFPSPFSDPTRNTQAPNAEWCQKTPGCTWTGTTCQCQSSGAKPNGPSERYMAPNGAPSTEQYQQNQQPPSYPSGTTQPSTQYQEPQKSYTPSDNPPPYPSTNP